MIKEITVKTSRREELVDITSEVLSAVNGCACGICVIYTPHTTAAVTINENADPDVQSDIIRGLDSLALDKCRYDHSEGNSPAHIKSSLVGASETVIIESGRLVLGTWQGIYFCEFDGPRNRRVFVKILEG